MPIHGDDDELDHLFCLCDPDRALCGTDLTDGEWIDNEDNGLCVVCNELQYRDCERCGE